MFVKCPDLNKHFPFLMAFPVSYFDKYQHISLYKVLAWKYNKRRNVNSDFSVVTMRRVASIFFELGVVKNFMQKI